MRFLPFFGVAILIVVNWCMLELLRDSVDFARRCRRHVRGRWSRQWCRRAVNCLRRLEKSILLIAKNFQKIFKNFSWKHKNLAFWHIFWTFFSSTFEWLFLPETFERRDWPTQRASPIGQRQWPPVDWSSTHLRLVTQYYSWRFHKKKSEADFTVWINQLQCVPTQRYFHYDQLTSSFSAKKIENLEFSAIPKIRLKPFPTTIIHYNWYKIQLACKNGLLGITKNDVFLLFFIESKKSTRKLANFTGS